MPRPLPPDEEKPFDRFAYTRLPFVFKEEGSSLYRVRCTPEQSVIAVSPSDRSLGRLLRASVATKPDGQALADLVGDTMFDLFKSQPVFREQVAPDREVNKMLLEWANSQPDFEQSRQATIGNLPASIAAAGVLWEGLITDEVLKEALAKQKEAEQEAEEARKLYQQMANAAMMGDTDKADDLQKKADAKNAAAQAKVKIGKDQIQKLMNNPLAKGMMGSTIRKAKDEAQRVNDVMAQWGIGQGSGESVDVQEIIQLAHSSQGKTARIAKLIGRFKVAAQKASEDAKRSYTGTVTEVTNTKTLMKMFPTERNKLSSYAPPIIHVRAALRFIKSGLLGLREKEERKLVGGFVAEVDGSGSMSGEQEIEAKAIALGLAKALSDDRESHRPYQLATFGDRSDQIFFVTNEDDWRKHIKWAGYMPGGGTDFDAAFMDGIDRLQKMRLDNTFGCDLIIITDGWANLSDSVERKWREFQRESGARLFYIQIGGSINEQLSSLAELSIDIAHLTDEIAEQLVSKISYTIADRQQSL